MIKGNHVIISLLVTVRFELPLAADTRQGEAAFLILVNEASGNELPEQVDCRITLSLAVLHHLDLGLEGVELHELGLGSLLFSHLGFMLVLDLLLGPLSLATRLQKTGRHSFASYGYEKNALESIVACTYC